MEKIKDLLSINLLIEIEDFVAKVSTVDLEWAVADLSPKTDQEHLVGELGEYSRRLWTAGARLEGLAEREELVAKQLIQGEEKSEHIQKCNRYKDMCNMSRMLFWINSKDELNEWEESIGLRAGWELVRTSGSKLDFIKGVLGA